MNHALLVGRFQRVGDLAGDGQRFVDRDGPLRDPVRQGRPVDELEHECQAAVGIFQTVDAPDVGMVQRGEQPCLAPETGQPVGVGRERPGQHLERHVPVERGIAGAVDLAHSALAYLGGDRIRAECGAEAQGHSAQIRFS